MDFIFVSSLPCTDSVYPPVPGSQCWAYSEQVDVDLTQDEGSRRAEVVAQLGGCLPRMYQALVSVLSTI